MSVLSCASSRLFSRGSVCSVLFGGGALLLVSLFGCLLLRYFWTISVCIVFKFSLWLSVTSGGRLVVKSVFWKAVCFMSLGGGAGESVSVRRGLLVVLSVSVWKRGVLSVGLFEVSLSRHVDVVCWCLLYILSLSLVLRFE